MAEGERRKLVCVVEDNEDNRALLRAFLEDDYDIVEYESGVDALVGLPKQIPDIILLDIALPRLDGVEVLRRIRRSAEVAHVAVIALTAHAMAGDREKFLEAGFDDYFAKPIVDIDALIDAMKRAMRAASHR